MTRFTGASDARTDPDSGTMMHVIHDTDNQTTTLDQSDNNSHNKTSEKINNNKTSKKIK
jgi:hypothetical protein